MSLSYERSVLISAPLIVGATIVFGAASFAAALFDGSGQRQIRLAKAWGRALCWIAGIRLEVEGLEKIDPKGHYIFTPNHLSYMDTPVILASIPVEFRFMAKKELFDIPFMGTHLKQAGHIPVPLDDPRAAIKALSHAAKIIQESRISVLIFPEGGRSETGELQVFRDGAAYTAIKSGVTVVPVALCGTREILPMHSVHLNGGTVKVRLGDPIPTAHLTLHDRSALTERIRAEIGTLLDSNHVGTHA